MLATLLLSITKLTFWASAAILGFTYAGYPMLMRWLAQGRKHQAPPRPDDAALPPVTALVVACNEEARIVARVRNLLASDYPAEKLQVLIVSDGSTDATVARVEELSDPRVRVLALPERGGKPGGLNAGVAASTTEIIVFADARQTFAPEAIRRLASWFQDPAYGAVSGELEIAQSQSGTGSGVGAYWKMERALRQAEAATDSCIGCTGAIYAIRRSLFTPLPPDTILDDVVTPMRIALTGHRVGHDAQAHAYDPQAQEPDKEGHRKSRTLAGNFQMLFRYPAWLWPGCNRLWWRLIAHKYLRLAAPLFLGCTFITSLLLMKHPLYLAALLLQAAFYLFATLGLSTQLRNKVFSLPAGFVFLNAAVVRAFFQYAFGRDLTRWKTNRS